MEGLPNPNPELFTDQLTGAAMDEFFVRLVGRQVDILTINGYSFVGVSDVSRDRSSGTTTVECVDEAGSKHTFTYRPDSESPIAHTIPED